jgi:hypothetical protein
MTRIIVENYFASRARLQWYPPPLGAIIDLERNIAIWKMRAVADGTEDKAERIAFIRKDNKSVEIETTPGVRYALWITDRATRESHVEGDLTLCDPPIGSWFGEELT